MDAELEAIRALARASSVFERASRELSLAHYRVMAAVASGDERASRVAARLALGRPAVSAAVESLVGRGLLTRRAAGDDGRAVSLALTEAGQRLLDEVEAEMRRRIQDLCGRVPDGERLLEALSWLGQAVDERRAERWAARTR
jgi:DNA-binding MarR family transcriptional regulator